MMLGFVWTDLAWIAVSVFLIAVGLAVGYAMLRLAGAFARLSSLIAGIEREAMPVVKSVNSTVELVNGHLDNLGQVTSSAASAAGAVEARPEGDRSRGRDRRGVRVVPRRPRPLEGGRRRRPGGPAARAGARRGAARGGEAEAAGGVAARRRTVLHRSFAEAAGTTER
jgi:hypothetical protein